MKHREKIVEYNKKRYQKNKDRSILMKFKLAFPQTELKLRGLRI